MATQAPTQDDVFKSIVQSVTTGAAGMALDAGAVDDLRARYYDWIVEPGEKDGKEYPTPQEVWEQDEGKQLRGQFERIGRQAAERCKTMGLSTVGAKETDEAAAAVEADDGNRCPWCRP
jgi:hypothetical protein